MSLLSSIKHLDINREIINTLVEMNGVRYNLHKTSEECQELGLVLNQYLLKPTKVDKQEIIDEIGDVLQRIEILVKLRDENGNLMFPMEAIQARINHKLSNYKTYIDHKTYEKI